MTSKQTKFFVIFGLILVSVARVGGNIEPPVASEDNDKGYGYELGLKENAKQNRDKSINDRHNPVDYSDQIGNSVKKIIEDLKKKVDSVETSNKSLQARLELYEKKLSNANNELNEDMVGRMTWQLTWFLILLSLAALIGSGGAIAVYKAMIKSFTTSLDDFKRKAKTTLNAAYQASLANFQACYASISVLKELPRADKVRILNRVEIAVSRLRVGLGDNSEVIVGANILSQLGTLEGDGPVLGEALKREELSDEARATLERAIRDLEEKPK